MQPVIASGDNLDPRFNELERLIRVFKPERMVYLTATVASFMVLLVTAIVVIKNGQQNYVALGGFFGSTGIVGYSANRLLRMWDQSFQLLLSVNPRNDGEAKAAND